MGTGHLARANGAIDGPYCSPTWPGVFGKRGEGVSQGHVGRASSTTDGRRPTADGDGDGDEAITSNQ
jgi:hypothetical protein